MIGVLTVCGQIRNVSVNTNGVVVAPGNFFATNANKVVITLNGISTNQTLNTPTVKNGLFMVDKTTGVPTWSMFPELGGASSTLVISNSVSSVLTLSSNGFLNVSGGIIARGLPPLSIIGQNVIGNVLAFTNGVGYLQSYDYLANAYRVQRIVGNSIVFQNSSDDSMVLTNRFLGIGTYSAGVPPAAPLHVISSGSEQIRYGIDPTHYMSLNVSAAGNGNITPTGTNVTVKSDLTVEQKLGVGLVNPNSNIDTSGSILARGSPPAGIGSTTAAGNFLEYIGGQGYLQAYDYGTAAYKVQRIVGSSIVLQNSTDNSMVITNQTVGIGTAAANVAPAASLHILRNTTEHIRLGVDTTNYVSIGSTTTGNGKITPSGGLVTIQGSLTVTNGALVGSMTNTSLTASSPVKTDANKKLISGSIDISSSDITGSLAEARFPAMKGVVTNLVGSLTNSFSASTGSGAVVLSTGASITNLAVINAATFNDDVSIGGDVNIVGGLSLPGAPLDINSGGTHATDRTNAFDNIAPSTSSSGDIIQYSGSHWVRLPKGTSGQVLTTGTATNSWTTLSTAPTTGTGVTNIANVLYASIDPGNAVTFATNANGRIAISSVPLAVGIQVHSILGNTNAGVQYPSPIDILDFKPYLQLDYPDLPGNFPISKFNGGTGADATTFWRGDGIWAVPSGGGGGTNGFAPVGTVVNTGTPVNQAVPVYNGTSGTNIAPSSVTIASGVVTATSFTGAGTGLTSIPAGQLTGTIAAARMPAFTGVVTNAAGSVATGFSASSGSGAVALTNGPTISSPTFTGQPGITDFTLANHTHIDTANGGTLSAAAIGSGTLAIVRGGTGQTTRQSAFDGLAPVSPTSGDTITWNGTHWTNSVAGGGSGTVTSISGTANEIAVATGTTTPVLSFPNGHSGSGAVVLSNAPVLLQPTFDVAVITSGAISGYVGATGAIPGTNAGVALEGVGYDVGLLTGSGIGHGIVVRNAGTNLTTVTDGLQIGAGFSVGGGAWAQSILSATATLDFGNILAASSADLTITVTGATANDTVQMGLPTAPNSSIVYNMFVSGGNTVTVRAFNIGAIAVDPASATYRATVFHY